MIPEGAVGIIRLGSTAQTLRPGKPRSNDDRERGRPQLTSDPSRLRRALSKFAWSYAPRLMKWRTRRLKAARLQRIRAYAAGGLVPTAVQVGRLQYRPLISVLVPVYNTPAKYLRLAVDSVLAQVFPHWELILCDDCSTDTETLASLEQIASLDTRISVLHLKSNAGIATATNAALAKARGEFVAMLDHDDELLPEALFEVVEALGADRALDVIYTDQACIEPEGHVAHQFFKPDWSPEMFRGVMYVGHLLVVRRSLANAAGGFDPAFDNVQDYEFMLRLSEKTDRIAHIPKILYHWRMIPGSVAAGAHEKDHIEERQAAAVNAHLARCGIEATAQPNPRHPHRLLISPKPRSHYPLTTVIVRAARAEACIKTCCERLLSDTAHIKLELIVAGGHLSRRMRDQLESLGATLVAPGEDPATAMQAAAERAQGEVVVSMMGDMLVETPDWLDHLLLGCSLPGVGCVAPLVLSAGGRVSSAGLILGGKDGVFPAMRGWSADGDGYAGSLSCAREVMAVPGDCLAFRQELLSDLGGFDPYLASDHCQAVDLSLRASLRGLRNLFTPRVIVRHSSRTGRVVLRDTLDGLLLCDTWEPLIKRGDPYHNRNFRQVAPGYQT